MTTTSVDRPRTDDDLSYVAETMDQPRKKVAEALGRTPIAVGHLRRLVRYGDNRKTVRWTEAEDQFIRDSVGVRTAEAISAMLSGRTPAAVRGRVETLGIRLGYFYASRDPQRIGDRPLLAKTCPKCGLLLPSDWFLMAKFKDRKERDYEAWRPACRKCSGISDTPRAPRLNRQSSEWSRRAQALTVPLAVNGGQEYTVADHEILSDETLTTLAKALLLKRTYKAASAQCIANGYKSSRGLGSAVQHQWLIDNPNADRIDEITAMLNEVEPPMPTRPDFEWDD